MDTIVAVGTVKGLFVGRRGASGGWSWEGPQFTMTRIAAVMFDLRRDPVRLLAAGGHEHWGPVVARSDDLGATWQEDDRPALAFPEDTGAALQRVWQLAPGPAARPDEVWAGVEPAALFRSDDGGVTFELVRGLWDHPHRPQWQPGFGGLCLHTVLPDPTGGPDVLVAISSGGVYRSADSGASWAASNSGVEARFFPDPYPEFGQCVHKVTRMAGEPTHLLMQNHGGVFRSVDSGASWQLSTAGLPADFGFGVAAHPRKSGTAYLFPLVADVERLPPDAKARVYRTDDFGDSWRPLTEGLPQGDFFTVVLRDALTTDQGDPGGVYFGTRSGEVYASLDEGDSWQRIAEHLPEVLCVRAAVVG